MKITTSWKRCHSGAVKLFEFGGHGLYIGGALRGFKPVPPMIIFDLAGHVSVTRYAFPEKIAKFFQRFIDHAKDVHVVRMVLEDMEAPPFDRQDMDLITDGILEAMQEYNVAVVCAGGHGRSGSFAAVVLELAYRKTGVKVGQCPICRIRKLYCEKAVETISQVEWVQEITGIPVCKDHLRETKPTGYVHFESVYGQGWDDPF